MNEVGVPPSQKCSATRVFVMWENAGDLLGEVNVRTCCAGEVLQGVLALSWEVLEIHISFCPHLLSCFVVFFQWPQKG